MEDLVHRFALILLIYLICLIYPFPLCSLLAAHCFLSKLMDTASDDIMVPNQLSFGYQGGNQLFKFQILGKNWVNQFPVGGKRGI